MDYGVLIKNVIQEPDDRDVSKTWELSERNNPCNMNVAILECPPPTPKVKMTFTTREPQRKSGVILQRMPGSHFNDLPLTLYFIGHW